MGNGRQTLLDRLRKTFRIDYDDDCLDKWEGIELVTKSLDQQTESRIGMLLVNALLVFCITAGGMGIVLSAIDSDYQTWIVELVTLVASLYVAFLYYRKWWENVGYILLLVVVFAVGFGMQSYVSSGFYSVMNDLMESVSEYFQSNATRSYGEKIADANLAVTIAMSYIAVAASVVVNIFVSRKMRYRFLMLVVFAASFFGAFELTLPSKWSNAVDSKAEATSGLLSIFLMAFTLSLVSFSCTGPIIGFLLVQVSTTGSVIAPAIGMLGFAIALALPFTLFALFPSWLKSMPKSGGWMNVIKVTLGFLELAFALKFLSVADLAYGWRILDRETFLALWIVIFGLMGLYLLEKIKFPHDGDENRVGVGRFFLALVSLAFAVYMIPGLWGAPLKAVSAFAPPVMTQDFNLYSNEVHPKFKDYEIGMEYARQQGMPVMVDFTGYGCVNCRKMETAVWTDSKVGGIINDKYVLISLYVDDKTPLNEPLKVTENGTERTLRTVGDKWSYLQRVKFGANAQPFYVLLDNEGYPLNKSYAYNEDITSYIEFLQKGLEHYVK